MRLALIAALLLGVSSAAHAAASLTLPTITIHNPPVVSTTITCTNPTFPAPVDPSNNLPFATIAPGTALWNCVVAPSNWTGTVSLPGAPDLTTSPPSGNLFNVIVGATPLAAGTYSPGTLTSTP